MPRRFFRKFAFKRDRLSKQWFMAPFRHLLHDHRLWSVRRRTVVPALAMGVFIAWLPFPGHMLAAALLALALRINIPVATAAVWVSNPVTMFVMFPAAYQLGLAILNSAELPFSFEFSIDWVTHTFVTIWQPMLLGCLVLGAVSAVLSYAILDFFWRSSIANYKTTRRSRRRERRLD